VRLVAFRLGVQLLAFCQRALPLQGPVVIVTAGGRDLPGKTSCCRSSHQEAAGGQRVLQLLHGVRPWCRSLRGSAATAAGWPVRRGPEWDRLPAASRADPPFARIAGSGGDGGGSRGGRLAGARFPGGGRHPPIACAMRSCCGASGKSVRVGAGCTGPLQAAGSPGFAGSGFRRLIQVKKEGRASICALVRRRRHLAWPEAPSGNPLLWPRLFREEGQIRRPPDCEVSRPFKQANFCFQVRGPACSHLGRLGLQSVRARVGPTRQGSRGPRPGWARGGLGLEGIGPGLIGPRSLQIPGEFAGVAASAF